MRSKVLFQNLCPNRSEALAEFTLRIIQTAKDSRANGTRFDAGRTFVVHNSMIAPGAFVSVVRFRVNETNSIWTRLNAVSTANAAFCVNQFDATG